MLENSGSPRIGYICVNNSHPSGLSIYSSCLKVQITICSQTGKQVVGSNLFWLLVQICCVGFFCFSSFVRPDQSVIEGRYKKKCLGDLEHDLHLRTKWTCAPRSVTRAWESH